MKNSRASTLTAGVLYLLFGIFAAAVLILLAGDSPMDAIRSLPIVPGAVELFSVVAALMVASFVIGGILLMHSQVSVVVLVAGLVMAAVGVMWNVVAALFWLAPLPFMWIAYRAQNDD
jgi:hypothetical protein